MNFKNKYYVYIYLDTRKPGTFKYKPYEFNYEPFYVGMGKGKRLYGHLSEYQRNLKGKLTYSNKFKIRIINKIFKENKQPVIFKLIENLSKETALLKEQQVIKAIGRRNLHLGPLTNLTDGGDGTRNLSLKSRLAFGKKMKEKYRTGEMVAWNKGKTNIYSEEIKTGISNNLKEYYKTHDVWNKNATGKQIAWNKGLTIEDSRVKKYAESRKKNKNNYKTYKLIKNNKIIIVNNLKEFAERNKLNYSLLNEIANKGYNIAKWKNKHNKIIEYRYTEYKGYTKFIERK